MEQYLLILAIIVAGVCGQSIDRNINLPTCGNELTFRLLFRPRDGWKPRCSEDGNYHPQQCDVFGSCWCVNKETGRTVVGSQHRKFQNGMPVTVDCNIASSCPENMVFYQCVPCVSECQSNMNEECGEECSSGCGCPLGSLLWKDTCVTTEECRKMMAETSTTAPTTAVLVESTTAPGDTSDEANTTTTVDLTTMPDDTHVYTTTEETTTVESTTAIAKTTTEDTTTLDLTTAAVESCGDRFDCGGGRCVPTFFLCDGIKDCPGGEDEETCDEETTTVSVKSTTAGSVDVEDQTTTSSTQDEATTVSGAVGERFFGFEYSPWSDWTYCSVSCGEVGVQTRIRVCPVEGLCFGVATEEAPCNMGDCPGRCGVNNFECDSGECIPIDWRCDGEIDCPQNDTSDESDCSVCPSDRKKCLNGFQCVREVYFCDGDFDCYDSSDELNCDGENTTFQLSPVTTTTTQAPPLCPPEMVYQECATTCPPTCANTEPMCSDECSTDPCVCAPGQVLLFENIPICIPIADCIVSGPNPTLEGPQCPSDRVYTDCASRCPATCGDRQPFCTRDCDITNSCVCPSGYVQRSKDDSNCVRIEDCPVECPADKVYIDCASRCPPTCDDPQPFCTRDCDPFNSCICPPKYVQISVDNTTCILLENCQDSSRRNFGLNIESTTTATTTTEFTTQLKIVEETTTGENISSDWGSWSECSTTCGKGERTRQNICVELGTCGTGFENKQYTPCIVQLCPVETTTGDGVTEYTETTTSSTPQNFISGESWGPWGPCVGACDQSLQVRLKMCVEWGECGHGPENSQVRACPCLEETTAAAPTTAEVTAQKESEETTAAVLATTEPTTESETTTSAPQNFMYDQSWGPWGPCTGTCGRIIQIRLKTCVMWGTCEQGPENTEVRNCPTKPCHEETTTAASTTAEVTTQNESEETTKAASTAVHITTTKERDETTPTAAEVTTKSKFEETTTAAPFTTEVTTPKTSGNCPADRIYNECPSKCINTCDKHWPTCPSGCGENKCECKHGTIQESDTSLNCITLNECPIHQICPSPFVPTECASFCPITCYSRTRRRCTLACDRTKECVCPRYLVLHEGSCIEMSQCPDNCAAVQERATGNDFKPECDINGNYLLTQHDKYSDMKFCVDRNTGKIVMETLDYAQMFTADCKALADIPKNALYSKCPSACPRTCSSNRSRYCTLACDTSKIWECKSGYVENDGTCIKPEDC